MEQGAGAVPVLDVRDLSVTYELASGDLVRPLRGLSLMVAAGEFVAIYGPSGSGKTTLLKVLVRAIAPDAGTVRVRGVDIAGLRGRALYSYRREEIGFVPPSPWFVPGSTVAQSASLDLLGRGLTPREAFWAVLPLLGRLGLAEKAGWRVASLSAGEAQRVAIANALSTDPCLVIADEPTARLDPGLAQTVRELFAEVCRERGVATLMTTHDPRSISIATRGLVVRDGRLVEYTPDLPGR